MKKICFILSIIILLLAFNSCKQNKSQNDNDLITQSNVPNTIENISFNNNQYETNQENSLTTSGPPFYLKFQTAVDNNVYDKWLSDTISRDNVPVNRIYGEYLKLWKNELEFSVNIAKSLFDDPEEYLAWKSSIEQWLEATADIYRHQANQMGQIPTMIRLEIAAGRCELVRQEVINIKYWCYLHEIEKSNGPSKVEDPIGLRWANDLSILTKY